MKHAATLVSGLCCLLFGFNSIAQQTIKKPSAFNDFPKIVYCPASTIASLFSIAQGQPARIQFSENQALEGKIINKISKYNNTLQTLVIQIPAFGNSILSISKRKEKDNSDVFIGHLYNNNFADGFQLNPGKNNQYELVKIATDQVLQPCNQ
jgi:hypothetical protein